MTLVGRNETVRIPMAFGNIRLARRESDAMKGREKGRARSYLNEAIT